MYILLTLLFVCHFLGDYVLTTPKMLAAKQNGRPLFPILLHAGVHAILMFMVMLNMTWLVLFEAAFSMMVFQFVAHFITDVIKGRLQEKFPPLADPTKKGHWILFGADQLAHSAAIVFMCWSIANR